MGLLEFFMGVLRVVLTGGVFAASLHYMEGRRALQGLASAAGCLAGSWVACLLSDGLLYGVVGFSRRPVLELLAGMAMAALLASACSGARVLLAAKKRQAARPGRRIAVAGVRSQRLNRAA